MNENTDDKLSQAAAESARRGEELHRRIHDLTLAALKSRRFDRDSMRDVVRAVTEGLAQGAEGSRLGVRRALAEGFRGMDEALTASVEAGRDALRQMTATGRGLADNEAKEALAGLRKMEQDFVQTVEQVARSASTRVRPEFAEVLHQVAHAGTETGRHTARLAAEFTLSGLELAGEFSARFAQLAGGMLAGMADALEQREKDRKAP